MKLQADVKCVISHYLWTLFAPFTPLCPSCWPVFQVRFAHWTSVCLVWKTLGLWTWSRLCAACEPSVPTASRRGTSTTSATQQSLSTPRGLASSPPLSGPMLSSKRIASNPRECDDDGGQSESLKQMDWLTGGRWDEDSHVVWSAALRQASHESSLPLRKEEGWRGRRSHWSGRFKPLFYVWLWRTDRRPWWDLCQWCVFTSCSILFLKNNDLHMWNGKLEKYYPLFIPPFFIFFFLVTLLVTSFLVCRTWFVHVTQLFVWPWVKLELISLLGHYGWLGSVLLWLLAVVLCLFCLSSFCFVFWSSYVHI